MKIIIAICALVGLLFVGGVWHAKETTTVKKWSLEKKMKIGIPIFLIGVMLIAAAAIMGILQIFYTCCCQ